MEYTKNLKLHKPSYDDDVDIQVLNNNMDILDDRVGNLPYLPLAGGTMKGNIKVPYNVGLFYNSTNYMNFYNTIFNGVNKDTVLLKGDRFKYYSPSGKELVADDTGVWWDNDQLIRDLYTNIEDFAGYTKLSTGVIIQWGFVNPSSTDGNIQHVTLKTPMPTPEYVVLTSRSNYTQNIKPDQDVPSNNATFNFTRTGFDVLCARSTRGQAVFWFVIGGKA
nr:MAG TPA: putative tail fiber protein [Caudoviricetes sp.]